MATSSSSLCNFLSFLFPSKSPPQLTHFRTQKPGDGPVSLVSQEGPLSSSLASVICPTLAYANTLYFKSAYNVQVVVDDNEPEERERLLNRFRREVMRAGVIQECKRRRFFENKQDEKKRRTREAAKSNKRRRPQLRAPPQEKQEAKTNKKEDDDDEDNWDLPEEGDIP
ncbi:LOW QUALITY PROTEIN: 30S ribosomal protein S21, chloroplastic [Juglans microcarpa x Juglans regia]|uniref:LOW QUALITY PROTEIN: 30S ribosomal protein S21, chloroplastic n=1 Tax=Juglans microcarpa x Juglans regia TaxID=2249226 RepID=UPI001B7F41D2|nr:LOW QUALITY PROTEIN: 30S ribosomal protein S21, chloroplastic [Juglans microcarpa x Juglans regia]